MVRLEKSGNARLIFNGGVTVLISADNSFVITLQNQTFDSHSKAVNIHMDTEQKTNIKSHLTIV